MNQEKQKLHKERKGIRLYFWNLWYNLMPLIMVNFLFLLCCIPVVTIGPALTALNRICCLLAAGKPLIYPLREYWDAFRGNFKQGFLAGLICLGYLVAVSYCMWILDMLGNTSLMLRLIPMLALAVFTMCMIYVFPQIAMMELNLKQIFNNALRLMLVRLKDSLLALVAAGLVLAGPLYFWPMSMLLYLVLLFSVSTLISCSFVWPGINRYLVKED